jgi:hypothetical protein
MNTIETLTEFFGWCAVINIGFLLLATFFLASMRGFALNMHTKMFALSEEDVLRAYFQYLAQYKIAAFVLSVVPYLSLKLMS